MKSICLVCEGFAPKVFRLVGEFPICSPKCAEEWDKLTEEEHEDYICLMRMRVNGSGVAYG